MVYRVDMLIIILLYDDILYENMSKRCWKNGIAIYWINIHLSIWK